MVWGNFFGKNFLHFGGARPLPGWFGALFFRDEVPQSARLSAGGVQSLKGQCPNAFGIFFGGASLTRFLQICYMETMKSFEGCDTEMFSS